MTEYAIENGWLVEYVGHHTCGTGLSGYYGAHEPGCGLVPVSRIEDLLKAQAELHWLRTKVQQVTRTGDDLLAHGAVVASDFPNLIDRLRATLEDQSAGDVHAGEARVSGKPHAETAEPPSVDEGRDDQGDGVGPTSITLIEWGVKWWNRTVPDPVRTENIARQIVEGFRDNYVVRRTITTSEWVPA